MGLVTLSACSSNETTIKADESASDVSSEQSAKSTDDGVMVEQEEAVMAEPMSSQTASTEAGGASSTAEASSSTANKISICKNGDQVRTISVVYNEGGTSTACEVIYEKSTGVQSLWNAKNDLSYCENAAKEFVKKQEGWGWICSALE